MINSVCRRSVHSKNRTLSNVTFVQRNLDVSFSSGVPEKNDGYGKTIDVGLYKMRIVQGPQKFSDGFENRYIQKREIEVSLCIEPVLTRTYLRTLVSTLCSPYSFSPSLADFCKNWTETGSEVSCVLLQERSPTSARGRAVRGSSRALTSWHATTGNTQDRSRLSAICVSDPSPDLTIFLCTWSATELTSHSWPCEQQVSCKASFTYAPVPYRSCRTFSQ
jgi:hypothetical protein